MADSVEYLKNLKKEFEGLNKTFTTVIKVDESRIVRAVAEKMQRRMSGRTTEGKGVY